MEEKNPQALATAYRRAVGKSMKIKELKIVPKMEEDEVDALIEALSRKKAEVSGKDWTTHVSGQRWYVEDLVAFSKLNAQDRLEAEYRACFPDTATESELLTALEYLM